MILSAESNWMNDHCSVVGMGKKLSAISQCGGRCASIFATACWWVFNLDCFEKSDAKRLKKRKNWNAARHIYWVFCFSAAKSDTSWFFPHFSFLFLSLVRSEFVSEPCFCYYFCKPMWMRVCPYFLAASMRISARKTPHIAIKCQMARKIMSFFAQSDFCHLIN